MRCCEGPIAGWEGKEKPSKHGVSITEKELWRGNACREAEMNAKSLRSQKGGDIPWDPE